MQNIQLINHSDIQIIMSFIGLRKRNTAYCDGPEEMQKILQLAHVAIDKLQPDKMKKIRARTTKPTEDNRNEK